MGDKLVGYLLLSLGLVIIGFACLSVYQVFSGSWKPVSVFSFSGISVNTLDLIGDKLSPVQKAQLANPKIQLVSQDLLNEPLNLAAHLFLMGFVVSVGFRIGSLGVQLIRTINVNVNENNRYER